MERTSTITTPYTRNNPTTVLNFNSFISVGVHTFQTSDNLNYLEYGSLQAEDPGSIRADDIYFGGLLQGVSGV